MIPSSDRASVTTNTGPADPAAEHVTNFCKSISPGHRPRVLSIVPREGCEPLNCFSNVRNQVEQLGGRIQFGWSIWEWPRVFIEAEHHAVYDPGNGAPWIDVTPAVDGETTRLFLPDDRATYDFDSEGILRQNVRKALNKDPNIREFFSIAERQWGIMNAIPGVGDVMVPESVARELHQLDIAKVRLIFQIGMKHTNRNDMCFCRSGLKFKKCHGSKGGTTT